MPELDRIVTYNRTEMVATTPEQGFARRYRWSNTTRPQEGVGPGRIVLAIGQYDEITRPSQLAQVDRIIMRISDADSVALPDDFPPQVLKIRQPNAGGDGFNGRRYVVTTADHRGRNRVNRPTDIADTWFVSVDDSQTQQEGNGQLDLTDGVNIIVRGVAREGSTVEGEVEYRLWASRRDPGPSDQLENLFRTQPSDPITRADITAVWRFRNHAGAVVPQHLEQFTDEQGQSWTVIGVTESGRGQFADLYCGYSVISP